jgi:PAS domain-containing protein
MKRPQVFAEAVSFPVDLVRFRTFNLLGYTPRADEAEFSGLAKRNPFAALAHGHDLAEAIVDAIREPLLVLDPDLRVIAASRSFYRTFAVTPRKTAFRRSGAWHG